LLLLLIIVHLVLLMLFAGFSIVGSSPRTEAIDSGGEW